MRILLLFVVQAAVFFTSMEAYSAIRCENLFLSKKEFKSQFEPVKLSEKQSDKFLDATVPEKESGSTTADRTEYKFTLVKETLSRKIKEFKKAIEAEIPGFILTNRDPITRGYRNVTLTTYSNRFKLKLSSGQKIVAKIRLRKYGLISKRKEVSVENFKPIEGMEDVSFLEFKIQNPEYENSVLKPRVKILDSDAEKLHDPNLSAYEYSEILQRTIALNPAKGKTTEETSEAQKTINETAFLMLRAIRGLHKKDSPFNMEYQTLYERTSYKAPIKDAETGETYEVQITIDENISAQSISFDYSATSYTDAPDNIAVTEVKLPISLIEKLVGEKIPHTPGERRKVGPNELRQLITLADYTKYPGLKPVMEFLKSLQFNNLNSFEENHGKLFHLRRGIEEEIKP